MKENELPAGPIATLIRFLEDSLKANGGDITRADFIAEWDEPLSPKTSAVRGGRLEGREPAPRPIPLKSPFLPIGAAFLEETAKAGIPVRIVDVEFTKRGEWTHVLAAETPDEYQELRGKLKPLEGKVVGEALRLAGDKWTKVTVSRQHMPTKKPDKIGVFVGNKSDLKEAPPELKAALDTLEEAVARSGRLLGSVMIKLEGAPGDYETTESYYYRLDKGTAAK